MHSLLPLTLAFHHIPPPTLVLQLLSRALVLLRNATSSDAAAVTLVAKTLYTVYTVDPASWNEAVTALGGPAAQLLCSAIDAVVPGFSRTQGNEGPAVVEKESNGAAMDNGATQPSARDFSSQPQGWSLSDTSPGKHRAVFENMPLLLSDILDGTTLMNRIRALLKVLLRCYLLPLHPIVTLMVECWFVGRSGKLLFMVKVNNGGSISLILCMLSCSRYETQR